MRTITILLLTLTTLPTFARWESCPTTCTPPTATATTLSRLPLYASAKFSAEIRMSGNPMWAWTKTAPTTCTPAQLANKDDAFVCNAAIGAVVMRTVRVRDSASRLTTERALMLDPEVPITRGTIRHCPMRLPDSSYSAEEREQCRVLDVLNGEARGPQ